MQKPFMVLILLVYTTTETTAAGKRTIKCSTSSNFDCGNGVCTAPTSSHPDYLVCKCDEGYTSIVTPCDYVQKRQNTAFCLSIGLGGFGADWFYLANGSSLYVGIGVLKMLLFLTAVAGFVTCIVIFFKTVWAQGSFHFSGWASVRHKRIIGLVISVVFLVAALTWWLVDWIRVLTGQFHDGNGHELIHHGDWPLYYGCEWHGYGYRW